MDPKLHLFLKLQHDKNLIHKEKQKRINTMQNNNVMQHNNKTAPDDVSFKSSHRSSMADAIRQVRQSNVTIPDGHYLRPENHKEKR
jgi:lipopolysaccharide export LptBFGC system permease protein LptF